MGFVTFSKHASQALYTWAVPPSHLFVTVAAFFINTWVHQRTGDSYCFYTMSRLYIIAGNFNHNACMHSVTHIMYMTL